MSSMWHGFPSEAAVLALRKETNGSKMHLQIK